MVLTEQQVHKVQQEQMVLMERLAHKALLVQTVLTE